MATSSIVATTYVSLHVDSSGFPSNVKVSVVEPGMAGARAARGRHSREQSLEQSVERVCLRGPGEEDAPAHTGM